MIKQEELGNKIQENRGKESRKKFSERTGIPEDSLKAWERGNNYPSLQNCELLKDEFGYDWNTFLNVPYEEEVAKTQQNSDICKTTGLSETAVKKLEEWNNSDDRRKRWAYYLSSMIENENFEEMLGSFSTAIGYIKVSVQARRCGQDEETLFHIHEKQLAQQYNFMSLFQVIMYEMLDTAKNEEERREDNE